MAIKKVKDLLKMVEIDPLKDFRITDDDYDIIIVKGEKTSIPHKFLINMFTEEVIGELPKGK